MSEIRTQSRPYAEAAFEVALADDTLDAWTADFSMIELAPVSYTHLTLPTIITV